LTRIGRDDDRCGLHALTGLPTWVVLALAMLLATRSWRLAVVGATFATPVVHFASLSLLAAALDSPDHDHPSS